LFEHLEMLPMDDYHEFRHAHDIQIEWWLYWCSNYVFITKGIVTPNGAMVTLSISSTSGSRKTNGNGATKSVKTTRSGGITKGGGVRASTSTWDPLPTFNPIVEFFHEL
jgi:hypothetical protein